MAHCLLNSFDEHRTYHLANLLSVCLKKEYCGLGRPDPKVIRIMDKKFIHSCAGNLSSGLPKLQKWDVYHI